MQNRSLEAFYIYCYTSMTAVNLSDKWYQYVVDNICNRIEIQHQKACKFGHIFHLRLSAQSLASEIELAFLQR